MGLLIECSRAIGFSKKDGVSAGVGVGVFSA